MIAKTRTPRVARMGLLAAAGGLMLLGGCGGTSVWAWSPAPMGTDQYSANQPAAISPPGVLREATPAQAAPVDAGVLVFSRSAFVSDDAPEAYRRDGLLTARSPEVLPDRLAWPQELRPDLGRTGSLRTSTQAERWVYPQTRRDHTHRRYPSYPHRGW